MVAKHTDEEEARWQAGVAMMREEQGYSVRQRRKRKARVAEVARGSD